MGTFRLGQGFKPVGNLVEAFPARSLCHAGVHVGVLVGLAGYCGFQIVRSWAEWQAGGRVAALLQIFKVTMCVTGFALGCGTE